MSVWVAARRAWSGPVALHGWRALRFGVVGITGVFVNTAILYLLVAYMGWNHLIAAIVATETSILSNFLLNDRWTFRAQERSLGWLRRLQRYNVIALGGLGISVGVLAALTLGCGIQYLIANLIGIAAAMSWNYVASSRFTWQAAAPRRARAGGAEIPAGAGPGEGQR